MNFCCKSLSLKLIFSNFLIKLTSERKQQIIFRKYPLLLFQEPSANNPAKRKTDEELNDSIPAKKRIEYKINDAFDDIVSYKGYIIGVIYYKSSKV